MEEGLRKAFSVLQVAEMTLTHAGCVVAMVLLDWCGNSPAQNHLQPVNGLGAWTKRWHALANDPSIPAAPHFLDIFVQPSFEPTVLVQLVKLDNDKCLAGVATFDGTDYPQPGTGTKKLSVVQKSKVFPTATALLLNQILVRELLKTRYPEMAQGINTDGTSCIVCAISQERAVSLMGTFRMPPDDGLIWLVEIAARISDFVRSADRKGEARALSAITAEIERQQSSQNRPERDLRSK